MSAMTQPVSVIVPGSTGAGGSAGNSGPNVGKSQQHIAVPEQHPSSAYAWLLAWGMLFLVLYGINKTRIGHVVVYYVLVLMIVFLLVTQYHAIAAVWSPFSQLNAGFAPNGTTSTSDATSAANLQNTPAQAAVHAAAAQATATAQNSPLLSNDQPPVTV